MKSLISIGLAALAVAQKQNVTPNSMNPESTGPFGAGEATNAPKMGMSSGPMLTQIAEQQQRDDSGGSGPWKANYSTITDMPNHTLYAPKKIPAGVRFPVIVWGNGGCSASATGFYKFLNEVASHGYYIVANGKINGSGSSKATDMPEAIAWIFKTAGSGQLANADPSRLAAAGQSCGGIQAYSASLDNRVKVTGIFNSGLINANNTPLFNNLTSTIGWFLGGPTDIAYENGERDYKNIPAKIPAIKANLDVGHIGTFFSKQGGKFGKAAVAFFEWQLKGDQGAEKLFADAANSPLIKDGWKIETKNLPMAT